MQKNLWHCWNWIWQQNKHINFKEGIIVEDVIAKFYPKLPQIALRFLHMREYLLLPPL